jgi:serine protease Do
MLILYSSIVTALLILCIGVIIAANLRSSGFQALLRSDGIVDATSDEAVVAVEQAKHSVVVIQVITDEGTGTGTGIVMTENGYIATNHHVVEGGTRIRVKFYDGTYAYAELIGSSEMDDLAVIKVERTGLLPATFAKSSECYVGQTVWAIGNPSGIELAWTTTRGIISYKDREVKMYNADGTLSKKLRLIQTDANVNPGNSGGPLVDESGHVVGVVSMKLANDYEGLGFAIPSDGAVELLEAIMKDGHANNVNSSVSSERPLLGIIGATVSADTYYFVNEDRLEITTKETAAKNPDKSIYAPEDGVYVMSVTEGMGSYGKLREGDLIMAVEGLEISEMTGLMDAINDHYVGETVTLTVLREGSHRDISIVLMGQKK